VSVTSIFYNKEIMATSQDILSFLKADKEARAQEKEKENEARVQEKDKENEARIKERKEDMAKIAEMIRDGVKEEIREAIEPVEDRLILQEKFTAGLGLQFNSLMKEVETLKESVKTRQELPSQSQQSLPYLSAAFDGRNQLGSAVHQQDRAGDHSKNVFDICDQARRTIGFTPIEPRMLELQMQSFGAKTMEEAKLMEFQSYLKCEMKVQPSEIEKLKIVRIFYPKKTKILYM
jgi:hypothetical protein